ncbi:hypothetical protein AV530_017187 [Patagioenas fasciata monilis]|uniref:Uncharacterized protein n=1 Tax=Patagioenas fasciata monilis TaxID=372326 RepID=A0A1V4JGD3_PATFA|nr:hypothetical protein AV530_017187 [Patagioenas fasciata monilis]
MSTGGQSLRAEDSPVVNTLRDWPSAPENKLSLHKKLSLVIQSPFKTGTSGICPAVMTLLPSHIQDCMLGRRAVSKAWTNWPWDEPVSLSTEQNAMAKKAFKRESRDYFPLRIYARFLAVVPPGMSLGDGASPHDLAAGLPGTGP